MYLLDDLLSTDRREAAKKELYKALTDFTTVPYCEKSREELFSNGVKTNDLLFLMSKGAEGIPIDANLICEALSRLAMDPSVRHELVFAHLKELSTSGNDCLTVIDMAVSHEGSVKLAEIVAKTFSSDLILALNGPYGKRIEEIIITILDHPQLCVYSAFCKAVDDGSVEGRLLLAKSDVMRDHTINKLGGGYEASIKGKKAKGVVVELAMRLAEFFLKLYCTYEQLENISLINDCLWKLVNAGDPLTTLSVINIMLTSCAQKCYRDIIFVDEELDIKVYNAILSASPFESTVTPDCFRLLAHALRFDPSKVTAESKGWSSYFSFLKNAASVGQGSQSDWEESWSLAIELWGIMAQEAEEAALRLVCQLVPFLKRLSLKAVEGTNMPTNVLLSSLYAWSTVMMKQNSARTRRDVFRIYKNELKEYQQEVIDFGSAFVFPKIATLCVKLPFENIRAAAIRCLEAFLSLESRMTALMKSEEFTLLLRVKTSQPVMVARFEFIETLLRIYTQKELLDVMDKTVLEHLMEMKKHGYAYLVPSMRDAEVKVATE